MPAKPQAAAKTAKKVSSKPAEKKTAEPKAAKKQAPAKAEKQAQKKPAKPAAEKAPPAKKAAKPAAVKKEVAAKKTAEAKSAPPAAKKTAPAVSKPAPAPAPTPAPAASPAKKANAKSNSGAQVYGPTRVGAGLDVKITSVRRTTHSDDEGATIDNPKKPVLPTAFLKRQRQRLVELRDAYMNSAEGVANEQLRNSENGDASAFGMHQADAGSDAYDRDFALSLLAKEQDAIYEINEALKRIDIGTYGICEMSGDLIPEERLEALPFTRFTVSCQERIERDQMGGRWNRPVRSLFGLDESAEEVDDERDEDEGTSNNESLDFSKE